MIKKLLSLSLSVLALGSSVQTQAMEQETQTFFERHFAQPKNLEKTKKLTPQVQAYLEKLQTAATILDLQAEQAKLVALTVKSNTYKEQSSEALHSFKPQALIKDTSTDEKWKTDDISKFIPQTSEACVIYLCYKHLFLTKPLHLSKELTKLPQLSKELVQLIESLTLSHNQELQDMGMLLYNKYADHFYMQEVTKALENLSNLNPAADEYINYKFLSYRKKFPEFEPYLATITRFLKVLDTFASADNKIRAYTTLMKQSAIILNLYKSSQASTQLLYNYLYQQLQQAYTLLKNAGISGNKLIKYKQSAVLNRPLPQTLATIEDIAPICHFEEVYKEFKKEQHNPFSFLDITKLSSTLKQSHKLPQNKQVFTQDIEQSQTQEISQETPTEKPVETATQTIVPGPTSSTNTIRDMGRYVIDESHELYVEIYDRSTEYTYMLYRIPGLSNSPEKLFQQFEYDQRVTEWFTDPLKRLQEDGYTTPGHKYYTAPGGYNRKILLHAFAPIIDDYIAPLGYVSASPYEPQTDKNIRILGELRKSGQPTTYVYFTYNIYKKAGQWRCNHRCIEIKPKSEFLATQLEHAKYEVNFPSLK